MVNPIVKQISALIVAYFLILSGFNRLILLKFVKIHGTQRDISHPRLFERTATELD